MPIKTYHVKWDELKQFGYERIDGPISLANTLEVGSPKDADAVVVPVPLRDHTNPILHWEVAKKIIDYLGVDERRTVWFDCSDDEWTDHGLVPNAMYIRCNLKPFMKREMPNSIAWFWPVENYKECIPVPEGGFKYDVSGHMWISGGCRKNSCESLLNTPELKCDIQMFSNFTGYVYHLPEGIEKRKNFRISMQNSRLALCPISIPSVFPYRYYEAMSAARVPILVGDDFGFPFAEHIDYDEFTIRVPVEQCHNMGGKIRSFLNNHSDAEIIKLGLKARKAWETWLDRDNQSALWSIAVEERLKKNGLL